MDAANADDRPLRVLALAGSLRRESWNRRLLEAAAECAPAELAVTVDDGLGSIPLFSEDLEAGDGPEPVRHLRRAVAEADGLLIATPEYNHSLPGVLKNAIDWLSRPADPVLAGKPVAVIGVTSGLWGTRLAQSALRQVLYATESAVLPAPAFYLRDAATAFDAAGRLADERAREQLSALLAAFAGWIVAVTARPDARTASPERRDVMRRRPPRRILVRERGRLRPVQVEAIDWLEAHGDYVRLHVGDRTHLVSASLAEMAELLEPRGFLRIHRGAAVNLDRVQELRPLGRGRYRLLLSGGTELVVSRSYSSLLRERML